MAKLYVHGADPGPTPGPGSLHRDGALPVWHLLETGRSGRAHFTTEVTPLTQVTSLYLESHLGEGHPVKRPLRIVALAVLAFPLLGPIPNSLAGTPAPRLKTAREAPPADLGVGAGDAAAY